MTEGFVYFVTITIVEWIDIFTRPIYKHIVIDSINYCIANKGLKIYCWCLMSNHIHMIASASDDKNLSDILRDFKKFTSKKIVKTIKEIPESRQEWLMNLYCYAGKNNKKIKNFKVWQDGNNAKEIHSNNFLDQKMEYIHLNPVRAEIVKDSIDYLYSSASDYAGEKGLINIELA